MEEYKQLADAFRRGDEMTTPDLERLMALAEQNGNYRLEALAGKELQRLEGVAS